VRVLAGLAFAVPIILTFEGCGSTPNVTQATAKAATVTLAEQEACARAAREMFRADGYKDMDQAEYQNHYSTELGHCYILVTSTAFNRSKPSIFVTRILMDVFEHRAVGGCMATGPGPGVPAMMTIVGTCSMDLPGSEKRTFDSWLQWSSAAKTYVDRVP
jgi:hypothetical protein